MNSAFLSKLEFQQFFKQNGLLFEIFQFQNETRGILCVKQTFPNIVKHLNKSIWEIFHNDNISDK